MLAITCVFIAIEKRDRDAEAAAKGLHTPNIEREYLAGSIAWQLSAEAQGLMRQAFTVATDRVNAMMDRCLNPEEPD